MDDKNQESSQSSSSSPLPSSGQKKKTDPDYSKFFDALRRNKNVDADAADVEQEKFTLSDHSVAYFIDIEIDPKTNLLGNRWLTSEGSLFVVAPSGHGKSSFCIDCMIYWAIGRIAFGFKPSRPLKILMIESEDDDADNKAFVQVIRKLKLTQTEMDMLHENTRIEFRRDISGNRFFEALDQFLEQFQADIVIINPLTGFCTVELKDETGMNDWLRNKLNTVMVKHHCAPMIVAHMPKGQVQNLKDKEWYEWMYVLSGCTVLTNWARAILVFVPSKVRGVYKFITAKRPTQAGWVDPEYYFSHSKTTQEINGEDFEIIEWVPATEAQIKEAEPEEKKPKKEFITEKAVYDRMSPTVDYTQDTFRTWFLETFKRGEKLADTMRRSMIDNGLIEAVETGGKGAAKSKVYRKVNSADSNEPF